MQAQRQRQSDVVVAFPIERARRAVAPTPAILAPLSSSHRRSIIVPLRRGHAANMAAILVRVRRLDAEIEALTSLGPQRIKSAPSPKA
jgi:hypothetical protein